ncbi:MAG TPA: anhydro-N-acetylmuramic acid kinase [Gemmatimonadales bacterium]|nr:anhydro-N-acetylmuramic acid kinase [Gemmatimonadales bacterium]
MTLRRALMVGLMSGTSLDGVDAALVRFDGPTRAELLGFVSRRYTDEQREELVRALEGDATPQDLARLHVRLAEWAGEAVDRLLKQQHLKASDLAGIAFPGQTLWHEPPTVSWQLGEPAVLVERFGVRVVSGFRAADVAAGGQGAPLVPMADVELFGAPDHARILLNLGGMANLTWVERLGREETAFAFDTGPGMAVVDAAARTVDPTLPFDRDGKVSALGKLDEELLKELLTHPYFSAAPPKSTGREHFGGEYAEALLERAPGPDAVATALELTARTVAEAIVRWVPPTPELVVSGGGAHHPRLLERIAALLPSGTVVRTFDELYFPGDAKEAVAFALLGYLTLNGQPGNIPRATGARGPRVLGGITGP